jgi:transcriptional regulator with XRE-family HTH domain
VTTTDPQTGAVLLRQLRESRGWSWSDLARALRDIARRLAVTSLTHRQVASIQRTIARWESLTDPTSPGDRYQFLLAHLYARTPSGELALGPGSDFATLLDALRHFGTPPQRVRQLIELITQSSTSDDELLALLSPATQSSIAAVSERPSAEHEQREHEQGLVAVGAKVAVLQGLADGNAARVEVPALDQLRRAVLGHAGGSVPDSANSDSRHTVQVEASIVQAHRLYQLADYDATSRLLSFVLPRAGDALTSSMKAAGYLAAAKLATKLGDAGLAWVCADRCLRFATEAERPGLVGIAQYQVACALLAARHLAVAEQIAATAAERLASVCREAARTSREVLSVRGALVLLLAVVAARREDGYAAKRYMHDANQLAEQLGRDDNLLWTAFGPTNVAIHELSVYVTLGEAHRAFQLSETLDTDGLPPVLRGRRSQVHLELAWACAGQGDDSLAVLHLLEAERVASQAVSRNVVARDLLTTLLARERKSTTPGLRALASRAGIIE